jgi:hypothetical protein
MYGHRVPPDTLVRSARSAGGEAQFCGLHPGRYRAGALQSRQEVTVAPDRGSLLIFRAPQLRVIGQTQVVTLAVTELVKGDLRCARGAAGCGRSITVFAGDDEASCGYGGFVVGGLYEVFAGDLRGRSWVGLCGGTERIAEAHLNGSSSAPRAGRYGGATRR